MPIRLLTLPQSLLLLGGSVTAGADVGTVAEVDAEADTARRRLLGARRAHAEGPLERDLEPGDIFRAESGEPRQLRRIGLCSLREALWSTHLVRGKGREKGGVWTHVK